MPLECDDFVFRKIYWPLPFRGGWVGGFQVNVQISLSVTKPNCWGFLMVLYYFQLIIHPILRYLYSLIARRALIMIANVQLDKK